MSIGIDRRAVHAAATDLVASRPRLADALTDGPPPPAAVDELLAELTEREAFGRHAEPWEVSNVIVFLASDYSGYMTGEVVAVSSQHP